ncbi:MAG: hypothetical protein COB20_05305 [SAR86 cluster bacterium]|uniref:DUF1840 domain-containing protein n=1 Tax=SAR86 cluster bacterium TaxID=2030880 RepID=A0A2A4XA89_9GAMM|nr:MAG: hypothetical protein COB20_05305 [SAR86 cluster bacterium]
MLIKFESKKVAPFIMQSQIAEQILTMAGQGGRIEGSISGGAISEALASLEKALSEQSEIPEESIEEDEEQERISLAARAAPFREMLRHALQIDCYVMWRPE